MPSLEPLLPQLLPYVLVLARVAGLFLTAPLLSGAAIPARAKAMLAIVIAASAYACVPANATVVPEANLFTLLPLLLGETLIGFSIGIIAALPLLSMEAAGVLMGQTAGFGLARVYNPDADMESDLLGQLMFYVAAGVFLAVGGMEGMFAAVLNSYANVPMGGIGIDQTPLSLLVGTLGSGIEMAVRVAAPILASSMVIMIVMGLLSKTMPQINVMTVGFTMKVIAALAMLAVSLPTVNGAIADGVVGAMGDVMTWARDLRPRQ